MNEMQMRFALKYATVIVSLSVGGSRINLEIDKQIIHHLRRLGIRFGSVTETLYQHFKR